MPNPEHLHVLQQGTESWNKWRVSRPEVLPDLSNANLERAVLSRTNTARGYKPGPPINLRCANLSSTNLEDAILQGAELVYADLSDANLSHADFRGADLRRANLSNSNLDRTDFTLARLNNADFENALVWETLFIRVSLSRVRGLESCRHGGPSILDDRTLRKSTDLPGEFLRGCGFSDWQIQAAKLNRTNLTSSEVEAIGYEIVRLRSDPARQYFSCFISYSHKDEAFVQRLHSDLQKRGIQCWYAPKDIQGGRKIHTQIERAIQVHDKVLLVLSVNSISSAWVEHEIVSARRRERGESRHIFFPISLVKYHELLNWKLFSADEGRDLALEMRQFFIPYFGDWDSDRKAYQDALERLVGDLKSDKRDSRESQLPR